jgi:hypothetical protein
MDIGGKISPGIDAEIFSQHLERQLAACEFSVNFFGGFAKI